MFHVGPDLGPNCLQKSSTKNIIRVSNSLDPDQDQCSMSNKFYQEHYQSIKQLGSRSGWMLHVCPDLFAKNTIRNIRVSNSLDPDQDQCSMSVLIWVQTVCKKILSGTLSEYQIAWIQISPDLCPNCLQRLSADDKSPLHLSRKEL